MALLSTNISLGLDNGSLGLESTFAETLLNLHQGVFGSDVAQDRVQYFHLSHYSGGIFNNDPQTSTGQLSGSSPFRQEQWQNKARMTLA